MRLGPVKTTYDLKIGDQQRPTATTTPQIDSIHIYYVNGDYHTTVIQTSHDNQGLIDACNCG